MPYTARSCSLLLLTCSDNFPKYTAGWGNIKDD